MKTKRKMRLKGKDRASLPDQFEPHLLIEADGRRSVVKELRRRVKRLMEDCGATSYQQEMLCEEAVYLFAKLETMRVRELRGETVDDGVRTQMINCLQGILSKLGLEKHQQTEMTDLDLYIKSKQN
jgi:hypothetical protein